MDTSGSIEAINSGETALRLGLAALLAALVGAEREWRDRSAGLRTHMLVSLGACAFTLASVYAYPDVAPRDPMRVAAQIVSGIGFLGAGVIIRSGAGVRGLTTAASLWASGAVGMLAGVGMFQEAAMVSFGLLFVLAVLRAADDGISRIAPSKLSVSLVLELTRDADRTAVLDAVKQRAKVDRYGSRKDKDQRFLELDAVLPAKVEPFELAAELEGLAGVDTASVTVTSEPG